MFKNLYFIMCVALSFYTVNVKAVEALKPQDVRLVSANVLGETMNQLNQFLGHINANALLSDRLYSMPLQEESLTPCVGTVKDVISMSLKRVFAKNPDFFYVDFTSQISGVRSYEWNEKVFELAHSYLNDTGAKSMYSLVSSSTGCEKVSSEEMSNELGIGIGSMKWYSIFNKNTLKQVELKRSCTTMNINLMPHLATVTKPKRNCIYFTTQSLTNDSSGSIAAFYGGGSTTFLSGITETRAFEYLIHVSVIAAMAELFDLPQSIFLPYSGEDILDSERDLMLHRFNLSTNTYKRVVLKMLAKNWGQINLNSLETFSSVGDVKLHRFLSSVAKKAKTNASDLNGIYAYLISNKDKFLNNSYMNENSKKLGKLTMNQSVSPNTEIEERIIVRPKQFKVNWKINVHASQCSKQFCRVALSRGKVDQYLLDGIEDAVYASVKDGRVLDADCSATRKRKEFNCTFEVTKGATVIPRKFKKELKLLNRT